MKIILSEKQIMKLFENKQEFDEVVIMRTLSREKNNVPYVPSQENKNVPSISIRQYYNDEFRKNYERTALINREQGIKIIWEDMLNIENYNDICYIHLNNINLLHIKLYDNQKNEILYMELKKFRDGYQISWTGVSTLAAGKRLAIKTYIRLSEYLKKPIYSDEIQTLASKSGIWEKLYELIPSRVKVLYDNVIYDVNKNMNNDLIFKNKIKIYYSGIEFENERLSDNPILVLMP